MGDVITHPQLNFSGGLIANNQRFKDLNRRWS